MKKAIIVTIILAAAIMLCGCGKTVTWQDGSKHHLLGRFIEINNQEYTDMDSNRHRQCLIYDKDTKVIYVMELGRRSQSISPYYINNNGHAEIAIYGVNYK